MSNPVVLIPFVAAVLALLSYMAWMIRTVAKVITRLASEHRGLMTAAHDHKNGKVVKPPAGLRQHRRRESG